MFSATEEKNHWGESLKQNKNLCRSSVGSKAVDWLGECVYCRKQSITMFPLKQENCRVLNSTLGWNSEMRRKFVQWHRFSPHFFIVLVSTVVRDFAFLYEPDVVFHIITMIKMCDELFVIDVRQEENPSCDCCDSSYYKWVFY